ncbi:MAG: peptidylprolyl isomerase, partial [Lutimonas sp.]
GSADASVTQTEEEAKKVADSVLAIVKKDKSKFAELAEQMSSDQVSGQKGGDLGWFVYQTMIPEFRDYSFENEVGDMGVVKSQFGFHVIHIEDQKNRQKTIQVGTFSRSIDASEKTENDVFERAETFASDLTEGKEINELAKESGLMVRPVLNLEVFDDNISQLGSQRQIVRWAFEENTSVGDIKRFDTDNGYVVVVLNRKNKAGLSDRGQNVRAILLKKKKAELIKERSTGATLEEIAGQNNTEKKVARAVSNSSPVFAGSGRFVDIAGVVTALEENVLTRDIVGQSGVMYALVTKRTMPTELNNYSGNKKEIERSMVSRSLQIYESIKDNSEIVDNRSVFY